MKKSLLLPLVVVAVIGVSTENLFSIGLPGNLVHAAKGMSTSGSADGNAEFAYEMAQITARIVSFPIANVEKFKTDFAYATAQVTAKVMPMLPVDQRAEFAYKMAQLTTKIINDPNLNIEKAKAEFAYEIAQLTSGFVNSNSVNTTGNRTLLRNNVAIELKENNTVSSAGLNQKVSKKQDASEPETYNALIEDLMHVGDHYNDVDHKVNVGGELRFHYAVNSGSSRFDQDSSGLRARLGLDTAINKDWRAYGMLEGQKNIVNYNNDFDFSRFYIMGKTGVSVLTAGSFGYLMAEGNIYDSDFDGIRAEFDGPVKYTASYGETDAATRTAVLTAQYHDFDYNLEAGAYRYKPKETGRSTNTILTFGGNYNFSNFGVGAMFLNASQEDSKGKSNGYVFSLNYGDLKTWRSGTYHVFAKYYNQPSGTYIAHGMNGLGSSMQGFRGYGLGMNYTFAENFVGGLEYFDLEDKVSGETGKTWWSHFTHYF